jgi:hypothetical protein
MKAATWLYDDDITAARGLVAVATIAENEMMKGQARKDIGLLRRTITAGQVKTASYSVNHPEDMFLRWYSDNVLSRGWVGRKFTSAYKRVGPVLADWIQGRASASRFARRIIPFLVSRLRALHPQARC